MKRDGYEQRGKVYIKERSPSSLLLHFTNYLHKVNSLYNIYTSSSLHFAQHDFQRSASPYPRDI